MAVETKQTLSPETIDQLKELIQSNIDSRDGFRQAAQDLDDLTLSSAFGRLADDREMQANELIGYVALNEGYMQPKGSFGAAVHRAWMEIREMMSSDDRYAILCEMERGEDAIKAAYEQAIEETAGSAMNNVLLSHYVAVKASHDRVRDLRDSCRNC